MKSEARLQRYKERARKARTWASVAMFALTGALVASAWQTEILGPSMKHYTRVALEAFEDSTGTDSAAGTFVQAAMLKLDL